MLGYATLSIPLFNGHFPGGPGLASSPFWILLELRILEVMVTTDAITPAKHQSNRHHQQTNIQFLQARCPSCCPTNSVRALKEKASHSMDLLTSSSPGGLSTLSLTSNGSCLPCGIAKPSLLSAL